MYIPVAIKRVLNIEPNTSNKTEKKNEILEQWWIHEGLMLPAFKMFFASSSWRLVCTHHMSLRFSCNRLQYESIGKKSNAALPHF